MKTNIVMWCVGIALWGLVSCGGSSSSVGEAVPEIVVHVDPLPGDTLMLGYVGSIQVHDTLLFLTDYSNGQADNLLQMYSFPSLRPLCRFVAKGKGPGEALGVSGFVVDGDSVRVLVGMPTRMFVYALADLVRGERQPVRIIPCPAELCEHANGFEKLDSGFMLVRFYGDPASGRVVRIDSLGEVTGSYYPIPFRPEDVEQLAGYRPDMVTMLWQVEAAAEGETVVLGTKLGDVLEIYNLRDSTRNRVVRGPDGVPEVGFEGETVVFGVKSGYRDLKIVGDRIYAMYLGERFDGAENETAEGRGSTLRVFDLDGKWQKTYRLDRPLGCFDMLADGRTVIAGDPTAEYQLYIFVLPEEDI